MLTSAVRSEHTQVQGASLMMAFLIRGNDANIAAHTALYSVNSSVAYNLLKNTVYTCTCTCIYMMHKHIYMYVYMYMYMCNTVMSVYKHSCNKGNPDFELYGQMIYS